MYKLLLIWRYLLTRYIALICVVSVMLGVATMIVVNAVMLGFSREMETRIHGVLSDVTVSSQSSLRGFDDVDQRIKDVWTVAGDKIEAVTPTVTTPGLLSFEVLGGEVITRQVQIIGIDEMTHEKVTTISQFLQHPDNRKHLSFDLRENGYQARNPNMGEKAILRRSMEQAGWQRRRHNAQLEKVKEAERQRQREIFQNLPKPQSDNDPIVNDEPNTVAASSVHPNNTDPLPAKNVPAVNPVPASPSPLEKAPLDPLSGNKHHSAAPGPAALPLKQAVLNEKTNDLAKSQTPEKTDSVQGPILPDLNSPGSGKAADNAKKTAESKIDPYAAALKNLSEPPAYRINPIDDPPVNRLPGSPGGMIPDPGMPSPLDKYEQFQVHYDKEKQQETGAIVGVGVFSGYRRKAVDPITGKEATQELLIRVPGDDITLSMLAVGSENSLPRIVYDRFTISDLYECRMAEYDETFVFVPIKKLQELRSMVQSDGTRLATHLLIKVKKGVSIDAVRDLLQQSSQFPGTQFEVKTWRDQQAVMLAAVATELSILNVLLFLIIAVAGFGILAIFFMIVIEKTRDIGILKSLGASGWGVMQIFLGYGLLLGLLGSGLGLGLGLLFVHNINKIAALLSKIMGHEVFDPSIYMFHEVPAIIEPMTVFYIMLGSIMIAVLSGVLPAWRAARLNPVDALRV